MQAVTLRRMKSDQYNGQPLVVLPPKVITVSEMQFSEEEEAIYTAFEDKSQLDFKEYVRKGFGANYSHILVRPLLRSWSWSLATGEVQSGPP